MEGWGRSIDIAPTVLELAKVNPQKMDGESMIPNFKSGFFPERDRYAEIPFESGCISMVRKDGYKLISTTQEGEDFPEHRLAVFDLETDPYEYVDLIDTPKG